MDDFPLYLDKIRSRKVLNENLRLRNPYKTEENMPKKDVRFFGLLPVGMRNTCRNVELQLVPVTIWF